MGTTKEWTEKSDPVKKLRVRIMEDNESPTAEGVMEVLQWKSKEQKFKGFFIVCELYQNRQRRQMNSRLAMFIFLRNCFCHWEFHKDRQKIFRQEHIKEKILFPEA